LERAQIEPRVQLSRRAENDPPPSTNGANRGSRLALHVRYLEGRKHLPIVALRRAA
jgi:hypothetical protein